MDEIKTEIYEVSESVEKIRKLAYFSIDSKTNVYFSADVIPNLFEQCAISHL